MLIVGEPDGQVAALEQAEVADAAKAMVDISKPISNGLTYDFTFNFEKAGQIAVPVPISAGESPRRDEGAARRMKPTTRAATSKDCRRRGLPSHRGQGAFAVPMF